MKMIIAIIRPERLEAVEEALRDVLDEGDNFRLTVDTVEGHGRQEGEVEYVRGQHGARAPGAEDARSPSASTTPTSRRRSTRS